MSPSAYDLTVAYRIYPGVSKTPPIFPNDKYKLAELCLRSFRDSLDSLRAKIFVILDNCPPEYVEMFRRYFGGPDLELVMLPGLGNRATFGHQIGLLLRQDDADVIYFVEDDYFHLPGQVASILRFMKARNDVHFITPYDHLDYYNARWHRESGASATFEGRKWRTVGSTTLTFLTTKATLHETEEQFLSFAQRRQIPDFAIWHGLTKRGVQGWSNLIGAGFDPLALAVIGATWYYSWRQLASGPTWKLWAPTPTVAAHLDARFLPPDPNWRLALANAVSAMP